MSYYTVDPWQNQSRQASWEHPQSSSGNSGSAGGRNESGLAFSSQMEEVDRAVENLSRSGKLIPAGPGMGPAFRRDPMMMGGPPASGLGPGASRGDFGASGHHGSSQSRHHSMSEFEQRQGSHGHGAHSSGNVQGFYQNQRYGSGPSPHAGHPGTRKGDADHSHQAQRRMAAQRERELRNYHQEQQYNRGKPERTISPNMSEEERRDLIARQHRALYGDEHNPVPYDPSKSGDVSQDSIASPQATANNSPPTGNQKIASASRTSNTPPKDPLHNQGTSSPTRQHSKTVSAGPGVSIPVAPIGTRPTAGSISQTKRPTPPTSSPLGISGTERAPSSASNPSKDNSTGSGTPNTWGSSSGVWGKNTLGVQASVWG